MKMKNKHNTIGELCSRAISRAWGGMTERERAAVDHIKWSWRMFTGEELAKAEILLNRIIAKKGVV